MNVNRLNSQCPDYFLLRQYVRIWAEKAFTVEVDHVVRVFCDPYFGFPRNMRQEGLHRAAGFKSGDEYEARFTPSEQFLEFLTTLAVNWPRTGDGFDKQ